MRKFDEVYLSILNEQVEKPAKTQTTEPEQECFCVSFKTTDAALVDLLKNGFAGITVKTVDENGEEAEETFSPESFGELKADKCECGEGEVCPDCGKSPCECDTDEDGIEEQVEEEQIEEEATCPECGGSPCTCKKGEGIHECGDITECGDGEM